MIRRIVSLYRRAYEGLPRQTWILFSLVWKKPEQHLQAMAGNQTPSRRSPWHDIPFLWLLPMVVIWGAIFFQLIATFPLYMREIYGLAENRIGQLIMINTLMIIVLEMLLIHWIGKRSVTRFIVLAFFLTGLGFALMPLGRGFAFADLTVAVWTFGEMLRHAASGRSYCLEGRIWKPRTLYGAIQLCVFPFDDCGACGWNSRLQPLRTDNSLVQLRYRWVFTLCGLFPAQQVIGSE